jgi:GNAT superfamily N-acetyltransferase
MIFRDAVKDDLPAILALLVDDVLGRARDTGVVDAQYEQAFAAVVESSSNRLVVADDAGEAVGCAQLTTIPGLSRHGATRLQIEAVRVRSDRRRHGIGAAMMRWIIDGARREGISSVQLISHTSREDAHRFYERLGFAASHVGMRLQL